MISARMRHYCRRSWSWELGDVLHRAFETQNGMPVDRRIDRGVWTGGHLELWVSRIGWNQGVVWNRGCLESGEQDLGHVNAGEGRAATLT